jgi:Sec-independent protein translocase protein TatA
MAIGWGELFLTTGVVFLIVGKKDLPVVARSIGGLVGRVVGTLQRARAQVSSMTKDNELSEVDLEAFLVP